MLGELARFFVALWHVAGLLLIVVLVTEVGVEGWRRLNRWLRYRRPTRPDRAALADAYGGASAAPSGRIGSPMSNGGSARSAVFT